MNAVLYWYYSLLEVLQFMVMGEHMTGAQKRQDINKIGEIRLNPRMSHLTGSKEVLGRLRARISQSHFNISRRSYRSGMSSHKVLFSELHSETALNTPIRFNNSAVTTSEVFSHFCSYMSTLPTDHPLHCRRKPNNFGHLRWK